MGRVLHPFKFFNYSSLTDKELWRLQCECSFVFGLAAIVALEACNSCHFALGSMVSSFFHDEDVLDRLSNNARAFMELLAFFLGFLLDVTLAQHDKVKEDGINRILNSAQKLTMRLSAELEDVIQVTSPLDETAVPITVSRLDVLQMSQRWTAATLHLLFEVYGNAQERSEAMARCFDAGLLTPEEHSALSGLQHGCLPLNMWSWQQNLVDNLQEGFQIKDANEYAPALDAGVEGTTAVVEAVRFSLPYAYLQLVGSALKICNLAASAHWGMMFTRSLAHSEDVEVLVHVASFLVLTGFNNATFNLCMSLANPLQADSISVPIEYLRDNLREDVKFLNKARDSFPPLLTWTWRPVVVDS